MKDNHPLSDELIDTLPQDELAYLYLVSKVTPEQEQRIFARLKELAPQR